MSKNTIIALIALALIAVFVGYAKYVLIPNYNATVAQLPQPTPTTVPISDQNTAGVPMGDAISAKKTSAQFLESLSDRQKIQQLFAISVPVPIATNSGSYKLVEDNLPGIIVLVGNTSTASAEKAVSLIGPVTATQSAQLSLFATTPTGAKPKLCTYDQDCLDYMRTLGVPITLSEPLNASASAADALTALNTGSTVVTLGTRVKQPELTQLVDQLLEKYSNEEAFKKRVDKNVLQLISFKQEYH